MQRVAIGMGLVRSSNRARGHETIAAVGDRAAIERELAAGHGASFAWAMSVCRYHRQEAEDVLHTTYVKVLDGSARWDGRATFKTWLYAVIRHTAADRRRRRLVATLGLARLFDGPPDLPAGPFDAVDQRQRQIRVRRALVGLSARQREVLELVFFHDLTIEQAAEVMAVSVGSARQHYERGKRHLRQELT